MLTWSTIQRLSRTGLFIPTSLVSCWLLTLRVWDGGVEHLQRHFSEKINISGNRIQQGKKLVKAQTAVRRICLITLMWEIFFSCFFFSQSKAHWYQQKTFHRFQSFRLGPQRQCLQARSQLSLLSAVNYYTHKRALIVARIILKDLSKTCYFQFILEQIVITVV